MATSLLNLHDFLYIMLSTPILDNNLQLYTCVCNSTQIYSQQHPIHLRPTSPLSSSRLTNFLAFLLTPVGRSNISIIPARGTTDRKLPTATVTSAFTNKVKIGFLCQDCYYLLYRHTKMRAGLSIFKLQLGASMGCNSVGLFVENKCGKNV